MPSPVKTVDVLQQYLSGVLGRADHHADNVNEIVLTLVGAILWRKDDDPIEVMVRDGDMKNVLWVRIGGARYSFSYDHKEHLIEMRRSGTQGELVAQFTNDSSAAEVKDIFAAL